MSDALIEWQRIGLARLDQLEQLHTSATGTSPGRRWGTEQFNRTLFVALVAQFQAYCRALHDEAVGVHVANATASQAGVLGDMLTQGRKIDHGNPRTDSLGSDFSRLGFGMIAAVQRAGKRTADDLLLLNALVDFRNAVVHGNGTQVEALIATTEIRATKASYLRFRRTLDRLARTMEGVVADRMADVLEVPTPW